MPSDPKDPLDRFHHPERLAAAHRAGHDTEAIDTLQRALILLGIDPERRWSRSGLTGVYGATTQKAVSDLAARTVGPDKENGREVSATLAEAIGDRLDRLFKAVDKLRTELAGKSFRDIVLHDKDPERIEALQTLLLAVGGQVRKNGAYEVDGKYGSVTRETVAQYASRIGRKTSGASVSAEIAGLLVESIQDRFRKLLGEPYDDPKTSPSGPPAESGKIEALTADPTPPTPLEILDQLLIDDDEEGEAEPALDARTLIDQVAASASAAADGGGVTGRLLHLEPVGQKLENWCWAASTEMIVSYLRRTEPRTCPTCSRRGHAEDLDQGQQANRRIADPAVDCRRVPIGEGTRGEYRVCDRGGWPYFFEYEDAVQTTKWGARRHLLEERGVPMDEGGPRVRIQGRLDGRELRTLIERSGRAFEHRLDSEEEGCALSWEKLTELLDDDRPVAFSYRFPRKGGGHMRVAAGYAETPGGRRWVAVYDPLPPTTGEIHFVPYEFYVDGPFGGHWRDFWIARRPEGHHGSLRRGADEFRVGRELTASYITFEDDVEAAAPPSSYLVVEDFHATDKDLAAALPEARAGLESVRALAEHAPELVRRMRMGGAFVQSLGGRVTSSAKRKKAKGRRSGKKDGGLAGAVGAKNPFDPTSWDEPPEVSPDELRLDEKHPVPIYELSRKQLAEWNGANVWDLLDRPRQILWEVELDESWEPFPFFTAVMVRRCTGDWKLSSLGRAYLMDAFVKHQLEQITPMVSCYQGTLQAATLGGAGLDTTALSVEILRHEAMKLGYSEDEISAFLDRGRNVLDLDKLTSRAAVLDLSAAEVREAGNLLKLDPQKVEGYLLPRDGSLEKRPEALSHDELLELKRWADEAGKTKVFKAKNIKFILHVRELYQLFAAYEDDHLEPLYPLTFHKPGKRVLSGSKNDVLRDLRRVAQDLDVERVYED